METSTTLLWHYTTGDVFKRILDQGAIEPDKTEPHNPKEIPTVTFSSDQDWERTRYRVGRLPEGQLVLMGKDSLVKNCGGLYRIGVTQETAPMDWHTMKDKTGLSGHAIQAIYDFAIQVGARTRNWYSTFQRVPEDQWVTVEKLQDGQWLELTEEDIPALPSVEVSEIAEVQAEA
jgi:hypothetical protein